MHQSWVFFQMNLNSCWRKNKAEKCCFLCAPSPFTRWYRFFLLRIGYFASVFRFNSFIIHEWTIDWRFLVNYCPEIDIILTIQVWFVYYSVESGIRWLPTFKDGLRWLPTFSGSRNRAVRLIVSFPFFPKQILNFFLRWCIPLWITFKISGFNCFGMTVRQSFYTALKNETFVIEGTQGQLIDWNTL